MKRNTFDWIIIIAAGYFCYSNISALVGLAPGEWSGVHYGLVAITVLLAAVAVWKLVMVVKQMRRPPAEEEAPEPPTTVDAALWRQAGLGEADGAPDETGDGGTSPHNDAP